MHFEYSALHGECALGTLYGDIFHCFVELQKSLAEFRIALDHPEEYGRLVLNLRLHLLLGLTLLLLGLQLFPGLAFLLQEDGGQALLQLDLFLASLQKFAALYLPFKHLNFQEIH